MTADDTVTTVAADITVMNTADSVPTADTVTTAADATVADAKPAPIRRARLSDVDGIHALLKQFSDREVLLPRSKGDLFASLREFRVVECDGDIVACGALQIFTADLGEVRSLAVHPARAGDGLGRRLVRRLEADARALGLRRIMALTYAVDFFHKLDYRSVGMRELPEKVWGVCINCPKFMRCDETAVLKHLSPPSSS